MANRSEIIMATIPDFRMDTSPRLRKQLYGILAVTLAGISRLGAQTIRGNVLDQSGQPIAGVVVAMLDSAGAIRARALSGAFGEFHVASAIPGTYRVRATRIGFRPSSSDAVRLAAGTESTVHLTLTGIRVALDAVTVVDRASCAVEADTSAESFRIWEQAHAALSATQVTAGSRAVRSTVVLYERTQDPHSDRIERQSSSIETGYVTHPWRSASADSLRRQGYVVSGQDWTTYFAPSIDVLLSPFFVEDHCFRVAAQSERGVGLSFEPKSERRNTPEIAGTIWLDRSTAELRSLDFRYVNIPAEQSERAGGAMEFARMKDGGWIISQWTIRMPELARVVRSQMYGGIATQVTSIQVTGGEVALALRGRDTLWSRPPLTLVGVLSDSASGGALDHARVVIRGTRLTGQTDSKGRFEISGVLPGRYTIQISTPSLDSVAVVHGVTFDFRDSSSIVRARVPSAAQFLATACGTRASVPGTGVVVGRVHASNDSLPDSLEIHAAWEPLAGGAAARAAEAVVRPIAGWFRICAVPLEHSIELRVANDSEETRPVTVRVDRATRLKLVSLAIDSMKSRLSDFEGTVLVDSLQRPIGGAEVSLTDLARTTATDEAGHFRLRGIPPGEHRLAVRKIGFGALDTQIRFTGRALLRPTIFLSPAVALDSVVVTESAILRSFEENPRTGLGHFLTRADLARMENQTLASIVSQLPGSRVRTGKTGHAWLLSGRGVNMISKDRLVRGDAADSVAGSVYDCYAQVYLDNMLMYRGTIDEPLFDLHTIDPSRIEAIEYYAGPSETPLKYSTLNSTCGVLVIWTRRSP